MVSVYGRPPNHVPVHLKERPIYNIDDLDENEKDVPQSPALPHQFTRVYTY